MFLVLTLASLAQSPEPPIATQDSPTLFTIHRAIASDDPPLWESTDGLVRNAKRVRFEESEHPRARRERDATERAFQEAVDKARRADPDSN